MKFSKIRYSILGGIVFFLVIYSNIVFADDAVSQKNTIESPMVASILHKHISDLNNQSTMHLNQGDKEKFVQVSMFFNYLIVMAIASLIVLRTRTIRHRTKRVVRLRH